MFICTFGRTQPVELYVTKDKKNLHKNQSFASLEQAIKRAVKIKKKDQGQEVVVKVGLGEYYLKAPLIITPDLSNLSVKGAGADRVRVKGSIPLVLDWKKLDDNIYVANVGNELDFDQLVINNKVQILARYPNYDESARYWQRYAEDAISKQRLASWKKPEGAYFHALHGGRWGGFHWEIKGLNKDGSPILEGGHQNNRSSKPHEEYRMVENVFEELDSSKEWYLDSDENKLYYWPEEGTDLGKAKVEVSVLNSLVHVIGSLDDPVRNVSISGIRFEQTSRTFMDEFEPLLRSDWMIHRGGVLFFERTENCTIEHNELTDLGGNGIMISKYNADLKIEGNHIHDIGASAVSFIGDPSAVRSPSFNYNQFVPLDEMDKVPGPINENYPRKCLVEDNLIYRLGRVEKQTAGLQISMAMHITARHNSIYDVPRAGINIGDGTWGGHIIEHNDVFNTVLETSDHGSFNSWGRDRFWHPKRRHMDSITTAIPDMYKLDAIHATTIRNNRFRCDHGWDIDLDDGSSNYHIYNNLCLNNGIKLREGFNRVVENNILVNSSLHPHVWFVNSQDMFRRNIVSDVYQDVALLGWGKELDYNFFPIQEAMMKSQIYDRDMHSLFGDPEFIDPDAMNFGVTENSKALSIGFENFPMDQFGVRKPEFTAMTKTPQMPKIKKLVDGEKMSSPVVIWLRNQLKNVDSEQEQSAYGLSAPEGVIVLKIWKPSPAVQGNGLRMDDVLLEIEGEQTGNLIDFLALTKKHQKKGLMSVRVMRDQKETDLQVRLK